MIIWIRTLKWRLDSDKKHSGKPGAIQARYILYIELVTLGTVRSAPIEPMNVYRVAVMKNATRVIAVHNHPAGTMIPSEADKNVTDRLIQVGRILNIDLEDHLIISPVSYISFKAMGLMEELGASLKYVPTYKVVDQIRKEEKAIAKEAVKAVQDKVKVEREQKEALVMALWDKQVAVEQIAKIMDINTKAVEKIITRHIASRSD